MTDVSSPVYVTQEEHAALISRVIAAEQAITSILSELAQLVDNPSSIERTAKLDYIIEKYFTGGI